MIEKIFSRFKKNKPELTVTMIADYSNKYYLIEAKENMDEEEFDPYFLLDKKTGRISPYMPNMDMVRFSRVCEKNVLYRR